MRKKKVNMQCLARTCLVQIIAICRSLRVACLSCRQSALRSVPPTTWNGRNLPLSQLLWTGKTKPPWFGSVWGKKKSLCVVFTPMSLNKAQFYSKLASQPSIKLPLIVQTDEWLKCHWHSPGCALSPARSADSSQQCALECVKTVFSLGKLHYRGVVLQSTSLFPVVSQLLLS